MIPSDTGPGEAGHVVHPGVSSRRVLVTGAAGFIGARLCRRLRESGAEVHGVSRRVREGNGVHWWAADLAEPGEAQRIMRHVGPDLVFHLASHVSGKRDVGTVLPTFRDNLLTTVNLLTAACTTGNPHIVLAGSMEECDREDPDLTPSSPYAAAKTASSGYARMFHVLYGLPVVNLRVFMVYGPGQWDRTKLVPYVIRCLLRGEPPQLGSGLREVDWVYVDDVVDAFIAAAVAEKARGETVDVGSGKLVTIRSVVDSLLRLTDTDVRPIFGALPDRPMERRRVANVAHTRDVIGWQPSTPLFTGLASTVQWLRDEQMSGTPKR